MAFTFSGSTRGMQNEEAEGDNREREEFLRKELEEVEEEGEGEEEGEEKELIPSFRIRMKQNECGKGKREIKVPKTFMY